MKQTILVCSDILTYHQVLHLTDTCKDKFASMAFKVTFDKDEPVFLLIRKDENEKFHLDVMPTCRNHRIPWVHPGYYYVPYDIFIAFLDDMIIIEPNEYNFPETPDYIVCKDLTQLFINVHFRNVHMDRAVKGELLNGVGLCDGWTLAYNNEYKQFTYAKEFPGTTLEMDSDEFYKCLNVSQYQYSDKLNYTKISIIMNLTLYSRYGVLSENIQKIMKEVSGNYYNDFDDSDDKPVDTEIFNIPQYYLKYDQINHVLDIVTELPEYTLTHDYESMYSILINS